MADRPRRPLQVPSAHFAAHEGGIDPAIILRTAHDSAQALVHRVRNSDDADLVERMVAYTDEHGLDTLAELWSRAGARSLPGALWRLSLLRALIRADPAGTSLLFQRGSEVLKTADVVVAGAEAPTGPDQIRDLADQVLRGAYVGDFAIALERAAAFCRTAAAGAADLADDADSSANDPRAADLTARAARLATSARDFTACARLERAGSLD
jgi:hypothetical protein